MRSAETVLAIIQERGKRGWPLEDIYRQLYNPTWYLRAYAKLYPNKGAMTQGATTETVDAMSMRKIEQLIDDIRHERYRWTPVRRIDIPKKKGGQRPLGLPTWKDKLLQEVMRSILEASYEAQMSNHSHGFRPDRGCHTALREIQANWTGSRWFVEGDIAKFFDNVNGDTLLRILSKRITDKRFLHLIRQFLKAGYREEWRYHQTYSGVPQGGTLSPILSNISLDELDRAMTVKSAEFRRGKKRKDTREYHYLKKVIYRAKQKARKTGNGSNYKALKQKQLKMEATDPQDPGYRRLHYRR